MTRDRAAEFRAKADVAALQALLTEGGARIEAALDAIDAATLGQIRFAAFQRPTSIPWPIAFSRPWNTPKSISARPI
jgi:hypothetical protein